MRVAFGILTTVLFGSIAQAQTSAPEVEKKLKTFFAKGDHIGVVLYLIDNHYPFYAEARKKGLADFLDGKIDYKTFASKFQVKPSILQSLRKGVAGGKLAPAVYSIAGIEKNGWFDTPFRCVILAGIGQVILAREIFAEPGFWAGLASLGWGAVPWAVAGAGIAAIHQIGYRHADWRDVLISVASYLVPGVLVNFIPFGSEVSPFLHAALKLASTYLLGGLIVEPLLKKAGTEKPKVGLRDQVERLLKGTN